MTSVFGGKVSLLDDARETLGAALLHLGYSLNSTDEAEIREAGDLVAEMVSRGDVEFFDSAAFAGRLASGEVLAAHGYSLGLLPGDRPADGLGPARPSRGSPTWSPRRAR